MRFTPKFPILPLLPAVMHVLQAVASVHWRWYHVCLALAWTGMFASRALRLCEVHDDRLVVRTGLTKQSLSYESVVELRARSEHIVEVFTQDGRRLAAYSDQPKVFLRAVASRAPMLRRTRFGLALPYSTAGTA